MVSNSMIQNYPINASDFTNSNIMFCTNLDVTRGKTLWQKLYIVVIDSIVVLQDFLKLQKFVNLLSDVVFVNGE